MHMIVAGQQLIGGRVETLVQDPHGWPLSSMEDRMFIQDNTDKIRDSLL